MKIGTFSIEQKKLSSLIYKFVSKIRISIYKSVIQRDLCVCMGVYLFITFTIIYLLFGNLLFNPFFSQTFQLFLATKTQCFHVAFGKLAKILAKKIGKISNKLKIHGVFYILIDCIELMW